LGVSLNARNSQQSGKIARRSPLPPTTPDEEKENPVEDMSAIAAQFMAGEPYDALVYDTLARFDNYDDAAKFVDGLAKFVTDEDVMAALWQGVNRLVPPTVPSPITKKARGPGVYSSGALAAPSTGSSAAYTSGAPAELLRKLQYEIPYQNPDGNIDGVPFSDIVSTHCSIISVELWKMLFPEFDFPATPPSPERQEFLVKWFRNPCRLYVPYTQAGRFVRTAVHLALGLIRLPSNLHHDPVPFVHTRIPLWFIEFPPSLYVQPDDHINFFRGTGNFYVVFPSTLPWSTQVQRDWDHLKAHFVEYVRTRKMSSVTRL
jgi:hypothetical protein